VLVSLTAALVAAVAYGVAAVLQGISVAKVGTTGAAGVDPRLLVRLLREVPFVISLVLNLVGFGLHVVALQELPLFLVQVALASSVAVTAVVSVLVLHQHLRVRQWLGVAAVCVGLGLLATSAESSKASDSDGLTLPVALFASVVVIAVVGSAVGRLSGALGAALLGLVAGTGFGVLAVAARLLPPGLAPGEVLRDPAVVVLVAAGAVAFLLYATAMQHGSVTLTTATLVLTQTGVPAALGIALLGDGVRDGTAPVAVLGFLTALAGVLALARFEHVLDPVPPAPAAPLPEPA
jgi:drug/metabolite transporter (DMT)-like permease